MNNFHFRKIKQLKDWERDLSAVLVFKNDMDEETRNDTIRYRDLLVYAIEQAERVQELEDKLARIRFVNNDYDKQNKHLKEVIKKALEEEQNLEGYESSVYKILSKALEGEND